MQDDDIRATPLAQLWLEELGGTVPEHVGGQPIRRRRGHEELEREDVALRPRGARSVPTLTD